MTSPDSTSQLPGPAGYQPNGQLPIQAAIAEPLETTLGRLEALVHRLRAEAPKAPESRPVFRLLEGGLNQAPREAPRKAQKVGPEGPAFCRARETAPGLSQPV